MYVCIYIYIYIHTHIYSSTSNAEPQDSETGCSHHYTRSPSQDFRLFGPRPWKILATTYEKKDSWATQTLAKILWAGILLWRPGVDCTGAQKFDNVTHSLTLPISGGEKYSAARKMLWLVLRPIPLLTLSLLTLLDSNIPGTSLWALEFHPFKLRLCLSPTLSQC